MQNDLKVGDWVRIIADGCEGQCGIILSFTVDIFGFQQVLVRLRRHPDGFVKYPKNIVLISEDEAMIGLLEDAD